MGKALSSEDRDALRNISRVRPKIDLGDLVRIAGILTIAAREHSVCAVGIGRKFDVSDAYAEEMIRNLCAAHLMFLHGDGHASLDAGFYKPVAAFRDYVANLDQRSPCPDLRVVGGKEAFDEPFASIFNEIFGGGK